MTEAAQGGHVDYTPRRVVVAYVVTGGLFTLAASLIWAINTIFLMRQGGLDLFQVMVVNSVFTLASLVFEVPTGVVADTIGRRASMLLCSAILMASTMLYVATPHMGWGMAGFIVGSIMLGLGFTFQTGAADAWLVDALDATGYSGPKERVFAAGQVSSGGGMLIGSILGGVLGQADLTWPYLVRATLLALAFIATFLLVRDVGFTPRELKARCFADETRRILRAGVRYGWQSPVVRPLLWVSGFGGLFFFFGFYAWQPYVLELLGENALWLLGLSQAGFSAAGILGNTLVGSVMRGGESRRDPARVLTAIVSAQFATTLAIAVVGLLTREPGVAPAAAVIGLWLVWGLLFGMSTPVRMSYINEHIPSSERATVLSLDAFFGDGGAAAGQPALGWLSRRTSIAFAWLVGSLGLAVAAPLYARSGRAARGARTLASGE